MNFKKVFAIKKRYIITIVSFKAIQFYIQKLYLIILYKNSIKKLYFYIKTKVPLKNSIYKKFNSIIIGLQFC